MTLDFEKIRADFPTLTQEVHGKPLVYLDSAATALKPRCVADVIYHHYLMGASNVHRGVHYLSEQATAQFEAAREKVRAFINARENAEIIFTSGTTASINLVAQTWGRQNIQAGDEILLSHIEHHSNIVPWQMLAEEKGATIRVIPMLEDGSLDLSTLDQLVHERTRMVAVTQVSNSLGTIVPVKDILRKARQFGALILVDAAQSIPHMKVDVQDLDCDFLAFSGHKLFAGCGTGVLYGRRRILEGMPPWIGGGSMIRQVSFEKTTFAGLPERFEGGTPNISGVISLGAAIDYLNDIGMENITSYEADLLAYGTRALSDIPGVRLIGTSPHKASILSFVIEGVHPHDVGSLVDQEGVAIRTGHHCSQPVMQFFKVPATARASLCFYNTRADIDRLVAAIHRVREVFGL